MQRERVRPRPCRLGFILIITAFLSSGSATGHVAGVAGPDYERRNIVFILTDDQRFDALGLLNDYFRTPNLDRLAEGGVLFENAFVTTSLCSPSRASILSGQYAHAHQV
ncbi:MAG: sulfatase-like hydrolase/transferase, partial [Chloroflexi bacterium]|nr:sulfatase-like hydrolase/transferase [Chloroflexota bacterium]